MTVFGSFLASHRTTQEICDAAARSKLGHIEFPRRVSSASKRIRYEGRSPSRPTDATFSV
jgi:hypothetical protein